MRHSGVMGEGRWHFWIDRGGTFTDVVARDTVGALHTAKLLSENPEHYPDAAMEAMRRLTGVREGPLPEADIRIGTTIATNALLERKGEPVLLCITKGFGDALIIGTQERPDIFARQIVKPEPLPAQVLEIDERVRADGTVDIPLDEEAARAGLLEAREAGYRAVAIALMHGYRFRQHEQRLAELAREVGFEEVAVSHRVSPFRRLIGRADTTCVDAYLSPVLETYVAQLSQALGDGHDPLFMQSNGGLAGASAFRGKDAVLSGPAGGIVGMARTSERAGYDKVIGFDMGGTSTDVSLYAGSYERDSEARVAGVRVRAPMMRIHTVAAGGGSICSFDGARFAVGPESAGAQPGPACYRMGGPLTLTDCNLILGKLQPDSFPSVFGPNADQPLDISAAEARMDEVLADVRTATDRTMSREEAAEGFVAIAVADMANAIRAVSVARGHDAARFALNCFGGAGGQHACLVADALGIETVLVHPLSGVLSAYGMGLADRREVRGTTTLTRMDDVDEHIPRVIDRLVREVGEALTNQGLESQKIRFTSRAFLRTEASDNTIEVPAGSAAEMAEAYAKAHRQRFGYDTSDPLVVDSVEVEGVVSSGQDDGLDFQNGVTGNSAAEKCSCHMGGSACTVPLIERNALQEGHVVEGPALLIDPVATIVVEPGWQAQLGFDAMLVLTRSEAAREEAVGIEADPVRLEIFGGLFMAIAEEMGAALQHSASSVNIRERLDFSCAVFDGAGNLVANAPHIPVHLGSMGASVQAVIAKRGVAMKPGQVYALNAPYQGGTHLPDITVIAPIFVEGSVAPAYFVAARGHHADIGGIAPGSMPSNSRSIEDEGIMFDNVLLVEDGKLREAELRELLGSGPHPARNPDQNIADLAAQVAACRRGEERLLGLVADYGESTVSAYMEHLQRYAEDKVGELLGSLSDGQCSAAMDNGAQISVSVTVDRDGKRAEIDFAGTSDQLPDNFNAPEPVVRAACLYAVRTLLDVPVPMNDGFLRPFEIRNPEGSMLSPRHPAAVVAGNVETSQIITDALMGAFGAMAASQGTMNNFTFGDGTRQYYETIAGGSGAGEGFDGADAVQTHMTNSRLTDPEVMEQRFPVLLERFAMREGSGGEGQWRGGNGVERRIRFLEPMQTNMLSGRRKIAAFGLAGGDDGEPGANRIERADGSVEDLGATGSASLEPGDVFVIKTPGGGGYGEAD